jgi:hypothetical protein
LRQSKRSSQIWMCTIFLRPMLRRRKTEERCRCLKVNHGQIIRKLHVAFTTNRLFSYSLSHDFLFLSVGHVSYSRVTELQKRANIVATLSWLPTTASNIPKARFIQLFSAGSNHVAQHPVYKDSDVPFCTASGTHGPQIAEWVVMTHLVHSHNYLTLYEAQKKKEWVQSKGMSVQDRVGRRVGILGYGSIGRQGNYNHLSLFQSPFRSPHTSNRSVLIASRCLHLASLSSLFWSSVCASSALIQHYGLRHFANLQTQLPTY